MNRFFKFSSSIALALLIASQAWAAIRTSSQAGNWSSSSTWGGAAAPGNGDQAVIGHAVTVDSNVTVGTSPPTAPPSSPSATATGGGASGGNLPAGTYRYSYNFVDASGRESSVSPEGATFTISAGNIPRVTISALVPGADSATLYLSNTGGGLNTARKYCTGITGTTVDLISASWHNTYSGGDADGGSTAFASADAAPNGRSITINSAGSVTVNSSITLTLRGDVHAIGGFAASAGSTVEFDGSASETAEAEYGIDCGSAINQTTAVISFNGSSGSRVAVRSNAGGGIGFLRGRPVFSGTGRVYFTATYVDFTRLGSITRSALALPNNGASNQQIVQHCVFDACGVLELPTGLPSTSGWSIHSNTHKNSLATPTPNGTGTTVCVVLANSTAAGGGVVRENYNCVYDRVASLCSNNATYPTPGNYYHNGWEFTSGGFTTSAIDFEDWFGRITAERNAQAGPAATGSGYLYWDSVSTGSTPHTNPHAFDASGSDQTFDGIIFEHNGDLGNGDCIKTFNGFDYTIQNCIVLPESGGGLKTSGTLGTMFSTTPSACRLLLHHNTICNSTGASVICEGGNQAVDTLQEVKSNLYWRPQSPPTPGAQGGYKVAVSNGNYAGLSNNILPPANATHNAILNGRTTQTDGSTPITKSYNYPNITTAPGDNDVDLGTGDQTDLFVDPTRNLEQWGREVLGLSGTQEEVVTDTLAALRAVNEPSSLDFHASATIANLRAWVTAGFVPIDEDLRDAAHDGGDIGAVDMAPASSSIIPIIINLLRQMGGFVVTQRLGHMPIKAAQQFVVAEELGLAL